MGILQRALDGVGNGDRAFPFKIKLLFFWGQGAVCSAFDFHEKRPPEPADGEIRKTVTDAGCDVDGIPRLAERFDDERLVVVRLATALHAGWFFAMRSVSNAP